jgi:hypothetical protein
MTCGFSTEGGKSEIHQEIWTTDSSSLYVDEHVSGECPRDHHQSR